MADILVVRHAQSVWNSEGRWQGQADPPLSAQGQHQARAACDALGDIGGVVSSDLVRACETAAIIAETLGVGPVVIDADWQERNVGLWQGLTTAEIQRRYPGALAAGDYPPDWETDESLVERVLSALRRLEALGGPTGPTGSHKMLAVSHAGVIYALERYFGYAFERIGNLHGRRVLVTSGDVSLKERIALIDDGARLIPATKMEKP